MEKEKNRRPAVRSLVLAAVFAALTTAGAYISIPTPWSSFTLQMLMVLLSGVLLGPKYGALSQIVYILLGLLGLPVFASGGGGFLYVLRPSFGFVLGFPFAAAVIGLLTPRDREKPSVGRLILACCAGWAVIYVVGVPYSALILNAYMHSGMNLWAVLMAVMIPFLPYDAVKVAAAVLLSRILLPQLRRLHLN